MTEIILLIAGVILLFGVGWLAVDYNQMHDDVDYMYHIEMLNQASRIRELELRVKELEHDISKRKG